MTSKLCPRCRKPTRRGAQFCFNCGERTYAARVYTLRTCRGCGVELVTPRQTYCSACGNRRPGVVPPPPPRSALPPVAGAPREISRPTERTGRSILGAFWQFIVFLIVLRAMLYLVQSC